MDSFKYIFGPVPSRRMGLSLGISPIPKGFCNYSCIYCQLGRTNHLTNTREVFFEVEEIIEELKQSVINKKLDVITIVGEGEPTLYKSLGKLIGEIKKITSLPIAVITNGALLYDKEVRNELLEADIVLPSFDACSEIDYVKINRPYGKINYVDVVNGLKKFSEEYKGQLWIETMIIKGYNDSQDKIMELKSIFDEIDYDRLFINTPVRPPAEDFVLEPDEKAIEMAVKLLGGTAINHLISNGFASDIDDDFEAIKSIIKRHPMNQFELVSFVQSRGNGSIEEVLKKLEIDTEVTIVEYKGYYTYRG